MLQRKDYSLKQLENEEEKTKELRKHETKERNKGQIKQAKITLQEMAYFNV